MKISIADYIELRKAGYTAEEINEYSENIGTDPAPTPAPAPDPKPADPTPAPNPEQKPADPVDNSENETQQMLREMLGMMRKGAFNRDFNPTPETDTAEIMASILSPTPKPTK